MQAGITEERHRSDFNAEAKEHRYGYRPNPVHARSFQILRYPAQGFADAEPVGDYTVLDLKEEPALSEQKIMNLVALLNGRKALMQLGHETGTRVLYNIVSRDDDDGYARILFYTLGREGVSIENALLRIRKNEHVA